ncbi:MAG: hypothetical protein WAT93_07750 [Pontixanthobacter sp.]
MKFAYHTVAAALLLAACSEVPSADASAAEEASGVSAVSVDSIKATRASPVDDQYIECIDAQPNGITISQFFLIKDGEVKSYSRIRNYARHMCDAGQPGCALGWKGDKVGLYSVANSGAVNRMLLDLETLKMEKQLTTASRGDEFSSVSCTSGPFPDGVVIE